MNLNESQLEPILNAYGLKLGRIIFVESGYRNTSHIAEVDGGLIVNLIIYKDEPGIQHSIERINTFSEYMHSCGIPVRRPVDSRILQLQSATSIRYACLYSFVRGSTIAWEMYSMKHIKLLGMAMGHFHAEARNYKGPLPNIAMKYQEVLLRMEQYFSSEGVSRAFSEKLSLQMNISFTEMRRIITRISELPNQQPLHMDMVRGNVLFKPAEDDDTLTIGNLALSGVIDLERASIGHPIFDIGRTHAFLLVDCMKPPEKIAKYLIESGYEKRGGRRLGEIIDSSSLNELYKPLLLTFLTYDLYKFLRQNPYESLASNHHFVRTRDLLVEHKMLQYT